MLVLLGSWIQPPLKHAHTEPHPRIRTHALPAAGIKAQAARPDRSPLVRHTATSSGGSAWLDSRAVVRPCPASGLAAPA